MIYQILNPIVTQINADSVNEAIKNLVKANSYMRMNDIIVKDQLNNSYKAKVRYYLSQGKDKVGIDVYPYPTLLTPYNQNLSLLSATSPINAVSPLNPVIVANGRSVSVASPISPVSPVSPFGLSDLGLSPLTVVNSGLPINTGLPVRPSIISTSHVVRANPSLSANENYVFLKRPFY